MASLGIIDPLLGEPCGRSSSFWRTHLCNRL